MIEMLFFYALLIVFGYLVLRILLPKQLNYLMTLGLSFGVGIGFNSLIFFVLSLAGLRLSGAIIFCYLLLCILALSVLLWQRKIPFAKFPRLKEVGISKEKLFAILVWILISVLLLLSFSLALRNGYTRADEYSYWGVASKRIFQTGSVDLRGMGFAGFEKYPLLQPITVGSASLVNGSFVENFSKVVNPIALTFLLLFLAGYFRKVGLMASEAALLALVLMVSGHIVTIMATSLYADVIYTYLYSAGVILFLLFLKEKLTGSRLLLWTSAGMLALASWTKIEGTIICFATLLFLAGLKVYYSKDNSEWKSAVKMGLEYTLVGLSLPLVWAFYSKLRGLGAAGWTTALFSNTWYALSHIANIVLRMVQAIFGRMNYSLVWFWVALAGVLGMVYFRKNKAVIALLGVLALNVGYHLATYLFVFGFQESLNVASFERYALHFLPLGLSLVAVVYLEMKQKYIGEIVG